MDIKHIGNPFTVIGVFATLSEVTMITAMKDLPPEILSTFVWFVMLFSLHEKFDNVARRIAEINDLVSRGIVTETKVDRRRKYQLADGYEVILNDITAYSI